MTRQLTFILFLLAVTFIFSCQNCAKKGAEKIIEKSIGNNADVNIEDEKMEIKTEEGTITADGKIKSWPKEIPSEVPEFKFGKIDYVLNQNMDEAKSWTILFVEVPDKAIQKYENLLKEKGFEVITTTMSAHGAITATKDKIFIQVMANEKGQTTLSVAVKN